MRDWQPKFLQALRRTGNVRAAAEAAGVDRTLPYKTRAHTPTFAAAWDAALEDAIDMLERVAWQRAIKLSDTLLIFLLKAHRPALYRDPPARVDVSGYVRLIAEREGLDPDEVMAECERIMHGG